MFVAVEGSGVLSSEKYGRLLDKAKVLGIWLTRISSTLELCCDTLHRITRDTTLNIRYFQKTFLSINKERHHK